MTSKYIIISSYVFLFAFISWSANWALASTESIGSIKSASKNEPFIRLIDKGKSSAIIIIPTDARNHIRSVADTLQTYIYKVTRVKIPITFWNAETVHTNDDLIRIWLGRNISTIIQKLDLKGLNEDGFIIASLGNNNVIIAGSTDWGTEFGVYRFLEKYFGVRWLFPGAIGEYFPKLSNINLPLEEIRDEPAFFSRQLSGLIGTVQFQWARRNGMHNRIKFHHNLHNLFPPMKYGLSHPEFYPIRNGKRYIPDKREVNKWQPCFTAPGLAEEAINNINSYFEKNQNEQSFSLGVNDGGGFCSEDIAKAGNKKNYLKLYNLSNIYFTWTNNVVEGVLQTHPSKWFGCLAYHEISEPPDQVDVHPRIFPFLTEDRQRWVDHDAQRKGQIRTRQWKSKANYIGWYDYIYGTPYMVPRIYFHQMADNYRHAYKNGIRAIYAEAYPNFGEGPKLYLALKLLWNPEIDVDTCLNDWYVSAVGNDAAPYLAAYYELWNSFWTEKIVNGKWFKRKGQIMKFWYPDYLDLVTYNDIHRSRKLLETTLAKTKTEKQRSRALIFLRAFEYYEASVISYLGLVKGTRSAGKNEHFYEQMAEKRLLLINKFQDHPVLAHPIRFDDKRFQKLRWGKKSKLGYFEGIKEKLVEILAK